MEFTKYQDKGDYHWRQFYQKTKYRKHALRVANWVKEKTVLDIGAGDGLITFLLGAKGIDNEQSGVDIARSKGIDVILGDAYKIPFKDEEFEAVTMIDVLEHMEDPVMALQEAKRVCQKMLYIATPPKRPDGKLTDKFHYIEWTPEELKTLVESQGFLLMDSESSRRKDNVCSVYEDLKET
jgi:ubiquinone/menaquinone biosynthesis C-methylase UbiE